jgi:predicted porin
MQKKLIALAVAGLASTGAFAQANVTVYGVADASFDVVRTSNAVNELGNTTRVSTNSSLIGFKGAEALGNGLTAVFQSKAVLASTTPAPWAPPVTASSALPAASVPWFWVT